MRKQRQRLRATKPRSNKKKQIIIIYALSVYNTLKFDITEICPLPLKQTELDALIRYNKILKNANAQTLLMEKK